MGIRSLNYHVMNLFKGRNKSLTWQQLIIVAVTLALVAAVVFLGSRTYLETKEIAKDQFNREQLILARMAARSIESYLEEMDDELPLLAEVPAVQSMAPECLSYMRLIYGNESGKSSLRRLDKTGILRFIYPDRGWRKDLVGRDYSEEAYFIEARETGKLAVSEPIMNEMGRPRLRAAAPVFVKDNQGGEEFNGVIICSFDIERIGEDFISPVISGKTGYAWLLSDDGIFLAHQEEEFVGRDAFRARAERNPEIPYKAINRIQRRMMAGEEGVGSYVSGRHREKRGRIEKFIAYAPIDISGRVWSVAVCAPTGEVDAIIQKTRRGELWTLGFTVLILIIGGGFVFQITYHRSRSLGRQVAEQTRELRTSEEKLKEYSKNLEKTVEERTRELKARIDELERFHDAAVDREFRIKELQDELENTQIHTDVNTGK